MNKFFSLLKQDIFSDRTVLIRSSTVANLHKPMWSKDNPFFFGTTSLNIPQCKICVCLIGTFRAELSFSPKEASYGYISSLVYFMKLLIRTDWTNILNFLLGNVWGIGTICCAWTVFKDYRHQRMLRMLKLQDWNLLHLNIKICVKSKSRKEAINFISLFLHVFSVNRKLMLGHKHWNLFATYNSGPGSRNCAAQ